MKKGRPIVIIRDAVHALQIRLGQTLPRGIYLSAPMPLQMIQAATYTQETP